jgi:glycosyltransferase involved in cell wall biosynthesis
MKIGYDAKRLFHNKTGLGNYSRDLIRILAHFYPENSYILYNPKPKKIDRIPIDGATIIEKLPLKKSHKKFSSLWRLLKIVPQIKDDGIAIFHGLSGEIPIGLKKSGVKTVVTIHDLIFMRYPDLYSFFDRKIHYYKFKYAAKKADLVIAISEQTKKDIVTYLKINPIKIKVIYQGCNAVFKTESSDDEKNELRHKYGLPEKFILNVGTIEKRKNLMSIIKSISDNQIPLVVVGKKTKYFNQVNQYISDNNLQNKVYFLNGLSLEELAALYQIATIFVYPSIFEGFGIPIIEALYSKIPVICSKGSCFSEAGGAHSLYVNTNSVGELKVAIESLWNNEQRRYQIIRDGFQFVQKFNDSEIAKNWGELYQNL